MIHIKKGSALLAFAMIFNLCAFPVSAGASTEDNPPVYEQIADIAPLDAKAPELKATTVLDIGRGDITISMGSITGFAPDGSPISTVNPEGYEITGSTEVYKISVSDAVPITINDITLDYKTNIVDSGIHMVQGGEITVTGTNTINRAITEENALIGQDRGELTLKGDGTLNMLDASINAPTIGAATGKDPWAIANIIIEGSVTINASKTGRYSDGPVIGIGYEADRASTIIIRGNAVVNASMDCDETRAPVIGSAMGEPPSPPRPDIPGSGVMHGSETDITISENAQVIATGGTGEASDPIMGTSNATARITIEDGAYVKLIPRSTFANTAYDSGMGFPVNAIISNTTTSKSGIKIAPLANVDAPGRENYYQALGGRTRVYKTDITDLAGNTIVNVRHGEKTVPLKTHSDGTLNLYLPAGEQRVFINGMLYKGIVDDSGNTKFEMAGPKLSVLEVSSYVIQPDTTLVEQNKPLIRQDGSESVKFDANVFEYGLYLRSIDTDNINVYVRHSDTKRLNIKVSDSAPVEVRPFAEHKVSLTLDKVAYQEIPILVNDGVDTITYVIKVFKPQKAENDPHVFAELEISPVKEVLELGIYATNVDVNAFAMTIKIDDLLAADKKAFTAFAKQDGTVFDDSSINLATDNKNYFNLDKRFEIADMRSDGQFISLTVNMKTTNGAVTDSIKFGATPEKILSISVQRNPNYTGNVIDEIDTLKIEQVTKTNLTYGNSLSSKFYGDMNDTFQSNRVADEKTLSYLVFRGKHDFIKMYISYDANRVGRVKFEIVDVSTPDKPKVAISGDVVNKEIVQPVIQSTYKIKVFSGGYLLAESEDVVYVGEPSKDGIIMTPVRLLEGDLNNSGTIDTQDRTKIISVLNQNVLVAGSGFVTVANDDIYADYNNDNRINSLDLGRLVQNIGKQYGAIHKA